MNWSTVSPKTPMHHRLPATTSNGARLCALICVAFGAAISVGVAPAQIRSIGQDTDARLRTATPRFQNAQTRYRARLATMLQAPWLRSAAWLTDYDLARAEAERRGRKLLIYFTRSYVPSAPCKQLEDGLLNSPEFSAWSGQHVLFAHITTRISGHAHDGLLKDKGLSVFPTLAFANARGDVIAVHTGDLDLRTLNSTQSRADDYLALQRAAAAGTLAARHKLLVTDLGLRRYDFAHGSLRLAAMQSMPMALRRQAEQHLIDIQYDDLIDALIAQLATLPRDEFHRRWRELTAEFFSSGRIPSGHRGTSVILRTMNVARTGRDQGQFARALDAYKKRHGNDPRYTRRIELYETQLEQLRASDGGPRNLHDAPR
jgi:hypothetical protein